MGHGRSGADEPFRLPVQDPTDAAASAAASAEDEAAEQHGVGTEAPAQGKPPAGGSADAQPAPRGAGAPEQTQAAQPGQGDVSTPGGAAAADGDAERQLQQDLEELAAKAEKADEYLALAQRTQADFENYRKRATREAALAQQRGIGRLARELLPAIDNLERAVQAAEASAIPAGTADSAEDPAMPAGAPGAAAEAPSGAESPLLGGLRLVHAEVLAALARAGIEQFAPLGQAFDPQHQEAVAQQPVEGAAPGTVVEVYQPGYRLGETVLRPARVLVAA